LIQVPDLASASDHLTRARELFAATGDPRHQSIALVYLGDVYAANADQTQARQAWTVALNTLIELDDPLVTEVQRRLKSIE
jgi:predicted negative regulator of RcsB-dependent stress response